MKEESPYLGEVRKNHDKPDAMFQNQGKDLGFNLLDFWAWNQCELLENRNRGILAEFLVMKALGIESEYRLEWDDCDFKIKKDAKQEVKIEVKSAAYLQSWEQKKHSGIRFDISPKHTLQEDNNYSKERIRPADIYIFCLIKTKCKNEVEPMNLDQWTFFLVSTETLNRELPHQKSIGLWTLGRIPHEECNYSGLKENFERLVSISLP